MTLEELRKEHAKLVIENRHTFEMIAKEKELIASIDVNYKMSNELDKIKAEIHVKDILITENFYTFIKHFGMLSSQTEYKDGWHVHAICQHLTAVTEFKIP